MNPASLFNRNLRHWTVHVLLSASGSFACAYTDQWHRPQAVVGMAAGIAAFIGLYTAIWNSAWFCRRVPVGSLKDRALLYATRLRSTLGVLCSLSVVVGGELKKLPPFFVVFVLPDAVPALFLGIFINSLRGVEWVKSLRVAVGGTDAHLRAQNWWVGDVNSPLPTLLITLTQGFLLSGMLLVFAAGISAVLRISRRRGENPRSPAPSKPPGEGKATAQAAG